MKRSRVSVLVGTVVGVVSLALAGTGDRSSAAGLAAFSPNDFAEAADDSAMIQAAVDAAVRAGDGRVVIPPRNARTGKAGWTIARAILLPGDVTVVLDNCRLTMADDVYENFFRSANAFTGAARDAAGALRQIRILGRGTAVLDGGKANDLCEATSGKDGRPHVRRNCPILFTNVRDFEVSGLRIENHRYWGMCFEYCAYGKISDIRFIARYDRRNQDGINLRNGCHDVTIEDISGQTGDDMIALSPIDIPEWSVNIVTNLPTDIAHVTIRNVRGAAVKHPLVAVRCSNDARVYDIVVENLADTEFPEPCRDCEKPRYAVVRVGNSGYSVIRPIDLGQLSDVTVRNVDCRHSDFGVLLDGKVKDVLISNVRCRDPRQGPAPRAGAVSTKGPRWVKGSHATLDNVTIENCLVDSKSERASVFDYGPMDKKDFYRDVRIVNCTLVRDGARKFIPCENVNEP